MVYIIFYIVRFNYTPALFGPKKSSFIIQQSWTSKVTWKTQRTWSDACRDGSDINSNISSSTDITCSVETKAF